jgi:hypothetical protein
MTTLSRVQQYLRIPEFSWARVVSDVVSPPVVWAVMVLPVAFAYSATAGQALGWALIYSLLICLLPLVFIGGMVWYGKIGDMHMKERRDRLYPFIVSILCTTLACIILYAMNAPRILPLLALISLINITVIAIITLMWQISMHAMSITSATIAVGVFFSVGSALLLVPLVVLVGAARLSLKRHTPAQILAGTLVGALVPVIVLLLIAAL